MGKLLGPKGMSLKRLQEETGTKMSILGKGSMRDKAKVNSQWIFEIVIYNTICQVSSYFLYSYSDLSWENIYDYEMNMMYLQEDELKKEGGKYAHLNEELHVLVEVYSEISDAYARLSHALSELAKFLSPVSILLHILLKKL